MNMRPLPFDPIAEARDQWCSHGWHDAADGMALVTSIARVQRIFMLRIDRILRPLGLSFARYEVLMILNFSRSSALPLGKIGSRLQVQPGAVTNAIDRLELAGLVARRRHPTDRRATLAVLTPSGRNLAMQATVELNRHVFESPGPAPNAVQSMIQILRELRLLAGDFEVLQDPAKDSH